MIHQYSTKKYLIFGVISVLIMGSHIFCTQREAAARLESEQLAKQGQEIVAQQDTIAQANLAEPVATLEKGSKKISAKDFTKMALLLNIQKSLATNAALKQSILEHEKKFAELELALKKKQQTWFDWAASFFRAEEPKKPRALGQFKTELAAAAGAYAVSKGNATKFDIQFLGMVWKKQKMYAAELKKIIEKQKKEIDRLQAQL